MYTGIRASSYSSLFWDLYLKLNVCLCVGVEEFTTRFLFNLVANFVYTNIYSSFTFGMHYFCSWFVQSTKLDFMSRDNYIKIIIDFALKNNQVG